MTQGVDNRPAKKQERAQQRNQYKVKLHTPRAVLLKTVRRALGQPVKLAVVVGTVGVKGRVAGPTPVMSAVDAGHCVVVV